ncbi:MAG: hypothetical protein GWP06_14185, partial [Actinobacteria bacterium]|nr:hypothetical protein [Actinomycetota bacterium]
MKNRVFQLFIFFTLGISTHCVAQIVLSEIMFNPAGNERYNEFVEIYNTGKRDTIDLSGWLVSDGTKMNRIVAHGQGTLLAPKQYALILVPKYFTDSKQYNDIVPADALVLTIANSQFGAYGFSNSRSEIVSILTPDSTTVASWGYRVKNPDGISEEKKVLGRGDFAGNWGNALVSGGTPGFLNSITPLDFDLAISGDDISVRPGRPSRKDSITISFRLKNIGSKVIPEFKIFIYDNDEPVFQRQIKPDHFAWLDSMHEEIQLPPFPVGEHELLVRADFADDQDLSNNEATVHFSVQPAMGDVVIDEIYSRPSGAQGRWIELQNSSGELLDLTNWKIESTFSQMVLPPVVLKPDSIVVLSQFGDVRNFFWQTKSAVMDFGDDFLQIDAISDTLVLSNENGATIDSIFYRIEMETRGKSLERRRPVGYPPKAADWGFCPHPLGGTPGEENAIGRYFVDVALRSDSTRIKFDKAHLGQDISFSTVIYNWGNLQANDIHLSLLEISGNHFSDTTEISSSHVNKIYPFDSSQVQLTFPNPPAGSHKLLFKCACSNDEYDADNFSTLTMNVGYPPGSVVINEIMYNTETKNEEWIELYNPRDFEIDLKGWSLADKRKAVLLTADSFIMAPGTYAVISHKPSNYLCANLVSENFPELNNTGDAIILFDNAGSVIDSIVFAQSWGGERFVSMERVRFEDSSLDSLNWSSCIDSSGNTAGKLNSISPHEFDAALLPGTLQFMPQKPMQGQEIAVQVQLINFGRQLLKDITVHFFYQTLGSQELNPIGPGLRIESIRPKEKQTVEQIWENSLSGVHQLVATVKQMQDQVARNDTLRKMMTVSSPAGAAIINEIMYNPADGMGEWMEIYNPSVNPLQLMHWTISDADTAKKMRIADSSFILEARQFLVLSKDSSLSDDTSLWVVNKKFPALGNFGDELFLRDGNGHIIDRVAYNESWGGAKGRSLERINPGVESNDKRNWSTCVAPKGHTAGK